MKLFSIMLYYVPESLFPNINKFCINRIPIDIVRATAVFKSDNRIEIITNKFRAYAAYCWDTDLFNTGGLYIIPFVKLLDLIALEVEYKVKNRNYNQVIYVVIDFKAKLAEYMYSNNIYKPDIQYFEKPILFGEIDFLCES